MREHAVIVVPTHSSGFTVTAGATFTAGEEPVEEPGEFAVVRPLPVIELGDQDELQVAPLEYSSLASRPEPVRVV